MGENFKDCIKKMSLRAKELLLEGWYNLSNLVKSLPGFRISSKEFGTRFAQRASEREGDTAFVWNSSTFLCEASNAEMCPKEQWQPILGTATLNLV